jgi:glycosyltransferase involved in cell wall biosynthesis
MSEPRLSVVTPTYERATTLPRLYESLLRQGAEGFEWIVVDDGSEDGSGELVRGWATEAPFAVEYRRQENSGKHTAVNRGVELARGEFCAVMDSDDWYAPRALERMLACWDSIPAGRRDGFANVEGLCAGLDGEPLGDRFPAAVFDSDAFEVEFLHGVRGDTVGMYRRDVLREFPFPEDLGWHVRPGLVWNRIAARYSTRFVDEVWAHKEYLPGGLTDRGADLRLRLTAAQLAYWSEFAAMPRRMTRRNRLRANANSARYSRWEGISLRRAVTDSRRRGWALAGVPFGLLLYLRDRCRVRAGEGGR